MPGAASTVDTVVAANSTLPNGLAVALWAPRSGADLPVVVLIHGSHTHPGMYNDLASLLADRGFVVVAPEQEREVFGDKAYYPQQAFVNWALDFAAAENQRPDSVVHGRLDLTKSYLIGHSMGGGTALGITGDFDQFGLVVDPWSRPESLIATVVMGTHNIPPPRTGDPIPVTNKVPLAFFQGSIDSVVTLDQSERTFAVVNGVTPRMFVTVEGGNHFFMTDVDNPPGVNEDKAAMGLAQDLSVHSVAHWIVVWFRAAAGDAMSREALMDRGPLLEPHLKATIVE